MCTLLNRLLISLGCLCSPIATVMAEGIPEPPITFYGVVTDAEGKRITDGTLTIVVNDASHNLVAAVTTSLSDINRQFSYVVSVPCETPIAGAVSRPGAVQLAVQAPTYSIQAKLGDKNALYFHSQTASTFLGIPTARGTFQSVNFSTVPYVDIDNDGLLDSWEIKNFGSLAQPAKGDVDGDGFFNLTEQLAGSDPGQFSQNIPFLQVARLASGEIELTWSSVADRTYIVWQTPKLEVGDSPTSFTNVNKIAAKSATTTFTFKPEVGDSANAFYRIELEP